MWDMKVSRTKQLIVHLSERDYDIFCRYCQLHQLSFAEAVRFWIRSLQVHCDDRN